MDSIKSKGVKNEKFKRNNQSKGIKLPQVQSSPEEKRDSSLS